MPFTTAQTDPNAIRTEALASVPISRNILRTVSAYVDAGAGDASQCFVILELTNGDTNINSRKAVLASGYIGGVQGVSWSGKIPMENDMFVVCRAYSSTGNVVKLGVVTEDQDN